jgi:hypothetical protein
MYLKSNQGGSISSQVQNLRSRPAYAAPPSVSERKGYTRFLYKDTDGHVGVKARLLIFMVLSTTLSVSQAIWRRIVDDRRITEWKMICKEAVVG